MSEVANSIGNFDLVSGDKSYSEMTKVIESNLPKVYEAISNFGKGQSQFMDNFLTVSHPTPLRNARQMLAEINKSLEALREAQYNTKKKRLEVKRLERERAGEVDDIRLEEIDLEISFILSGLNSTQAYIDGAVRAVTNYILQYNQILESHGYHKMTEKDFENEEERYHIMKSFDQAICAARARGGLVDEGNFLYLTQLGINGAQAQNYISKFFAQEEYAMENNHTLDGKFLADFLNQMAEVFKGSSEFMAKNKGCSQTSPLAILKVTNG